MCLKSTFSAHVSGGVTHKHSRWGFAKPGVHYCGIDPCTGIPQCGQEGRSLANRKWGIPLCPNGRQKIPGQRPAQPPGWGK